MNGFQNKISTLILGLAFLLLLHSLGLTYSQASLLVGISWLVLFILDTFLNREED